MLGLSTDYIGVVMDMSLRHMTCNAESRTVNVKHEDVGYHSAVHNCALSPGDLAWHERRSLQLGYNRNCPP